MNPLSSKEFARVAPKVEKALVEMAYQYTLITRDSDAQARLALIQVSESSMEDSPVCVFVVVASSVCDLSDGEFYRSSIFLHQFTEGSSVPESSTEGSSVPESYTEASSVPHRRSYM
ncbi:hypothetical protein L1987_13825 [Smallanthus sonchifolius]|uniref:Uncharacterized protein n=1 Tax=Smallanthus sonchifolius TaxID=185202 RepID=A0ACB9JJN6_9ASTR|nr:hypothetical protein L1987_13825 [Smallanthus sonchifolius]